MNSVQHPDHHTPADVKSFMEDMDADGVKGTERLFSLLSETSVFFYPACGFDWEPLRSFSGTCGLFVYCDWTVTSEDFWTEVYRIPFAKSVKDYLPIASGDSSLFSQLNWNNPLLDLPWPGVADAVRSGEAWATLVDLSLQHEGERHVSLLYLAANPVEAYRKLFVELNVAPKFMCLRKPAQVTARQWWAFAESDGGLASVVCRNDPRPSYVLGDVSAGVWPLTPPVAELAAPDSFWYRELHDHKVCFYPACGFDWNPLLHLSEICDTFVYCDYLQDEEDVQESLRDALRDWERQVVPLDPHEIAEIVAAQMPETLQPLGQPHFQAAGEPWGTLYTLRHEGREIRLFYLRTEGVRSYWTLFKLNRLVPQVLCITNINGMNWEPLELWSNALGRVVQSQWPKRPLWLATGSLSHDWPLNRLVKVYERSVMLWTSPDEGGRAFPDGETRRKLMLAATPLPAGAVAPPQAEELGLDLDRPRLRDRLDKLATFCREHNISELSCSDSLFGCHGWDAVAQAEFYQRCWPDLQEWLNESGNPLVLTVRTQ